MQHSDMIEMRLDQSRKAINALSAQKAHLQKAIELLTTTLAAGGTIFTCGNGGSAAEALHLAEELTGRYKSNRAPLRALCLCADPTALTCIANDFGFEQVFARQLEALGRGGDLLVVFSTSGKSPNLLQVLATAQRMNISTLGLLGRDGGPALAGMNHAVVIDGVDSAAIQEAHQMIMHILCEACEHFTTTVR